MRFSRLQSGAFFLVLGMAGAAHAGPYADDMAKCFVKSSTGPDKVAVGKWLVGGLTVHPEIRFMATLSEAQREEIDRATGALFQRLLFESCHAETQQAIKYEGPAVLQYAFQVLGQASMGELTTDASVKRATTGFTKYMDEQKVKNLISPEAAKDR